MGGATNDDRPASLRPRRFYVLSSGWRRLRDRDGVPVVLRLYVDQFGELFEVDSWKVDFSLGAGCQSAMKTC